jgi:hypothetical protein
MNKDLSIIKSNYGAIINDISVFMNSLKNHEVSDVYDVSFESLFTPFVTNENIKAVRYNKTIECTGDPIDINGDGNLFLKYDIPTLYTDIISIDTTERYSNSTVKFLQISGLDIDVVAVPYKPLLMYYPLTLYVKVQSLQDKPHLTYSSYLINNQDRKSLIHRNL